MTRIFNKSDVASIQEEISTTVKGAVHAIIKRRIEDGAFQDNIDVKGRFFASTCEGIESILVPAKTFPELDFAKLIETYPDLPGKIIEDAQYLLNRVDKNAEKLAPADPYLVRGKLKHHESNVVPNVESTAFLVSTLLDIKRLIQRELLPNDVIIDLHSSINKVIINSTDTLISYHIKGKGWPSGINRKSKNSDLYFTWSTLETLQDVLDFVDEFPTVEDLKEKTEIIKGLFKETTKWVEDSYLPKLVNGPLYVAVKKDHHRYFRDTYNYLHALIILNLGKSDKYEDIITFINKFYSISYRILPMQRYETQYNVGDLLLEDSTIAPLALRGIVPIILENIFNKSFADELLKSKLSYKYIITDIIETIFQKLTESHLFACDSHRYELYYTERVIEALTMCYSHFNNINQLPEDRDKSLKEFSNDLKNLDA